MTACAQRSSVNGGSNTSRTCQESSPPILQCSSTGSRDRSTNKTSQSPVGCVIRISFASDSAIQPFNAVTPMDAVHMKQAPHTGLEPDMEYGIDDVFPSFLPTHGVQLVIVHDPIFDDPSVCRMFANATLSNGPFWHKKTASIVNGVAEIKPAVTEALARAVAVGLC
ncbi:hypothetical protein BDD12DRAFT_898324 [Trichophaea hybrida]|nr:hypothetical protein BDD12DRAFT_898324 [Trichophaea hybrida]